MAAVATVGQLIDQLSRYDRDQFVCVLLHSDQYPEGAQVFIQGVVNYPSREPLPDRIGLEAHAENREL